jgi:hypothetical protein
MGLSRLLLIATNSKKYISGDKDQHKLYIRPRNPRPNSDDPYAGGVVLCFQLDDTQERKRQITHYWALAENNQRCDGVIFFAQDGRDKKVICCVEMKSTNIRNAADQIKATRQHFGKLLREELGENCNKLMACIEWKACFYHRSSSYREVKDVVDELLKNGFDAVQAFSHSQEDAGPFLRGETRAESMLSKHRHSKGKNYGKK